MISMSVTKAFYDTPWLDAYIATLPKPANDDFVDAIVINGEYGRTTGTNFGASVEDGEPLPQEEEEVDGAKERHIYVQNAGIRF